MAGVGETVRAVLLILGMVASGFIFGKLGYMKSEVKSFIVKFLINLAVPCLCIANVFENFTPELVTGSYKLLLLAVGFNVLTLLFAYVAAGVFKVDSKRRGVFIVMCAFSNSIFIGFPVCHELFGDMGTPYVMLYYMVNTLFFWIAGAPLIYGSTGKKGLGFIDTVKRIAKPPLVALVVSVPLMMLGVKLPHIVETFCSYMSKSVTPVALLYVGFVIYEAGFRNLKPDGAMCFAAAFRLFIAPALMMGICMLFSVGTLPMGVYMVEAGMPTMTQSVAVSAAAGADEHYASVGMTLTTVLCLVSVPLIMLVLG